VQLETERLVLRIPEPGDVDAYADFFADPEVVRYTGGVTKSRKEVAQAVEGMRRHWDRHGLGLFSVVRKQDGQLLGRAGYLLWDPSTWRNALHFELAEPLETEIGWTFGRPYWACGAIIERRCGDWGY